MDKERDEELHSVLGESTDEEFLHGLYNILIRGSELYLYCNSILKERSRLVSDLSKQKVYDPQQQEQQQQRSVNSSMGRYSSPSPTIRSFEDRLTWLWRCCWRRNGTEASSNEVRIVSVHGGGTEFVSNRIR